MLFFKRISLYINTPLLVESFYFLRISSSWYLLWLDLTHIIKNCYHQFHIHCRNIDCVIRIQYWRKNIVNDFYYFGEDNWYYNTINTAKFSLHSGAMSKLASFYDHNNFHAYLHKIIQELYFKITLLFDVIGLSTGFWCAMIRF